MPDLVLIMIWTKAALADLTRLIDYLTQKTDKEFGTTIGHRILKSVKALHVFPAMGKPSKAPGTRELIIKGLPYLVVYRVTQSKQVEILRLWHMAQEREQ